MSFPGDQDARSPQTWQRPGSGYQSAGIPSPRDPVRGFPPTPEAREAEYASAQAPGWNGTGPHSGLQPGPGDDGSGLGAGVLTADGPRPGPFETHATPDGAGLNGVHSNGLGTNGLAAKGGPGVKGWNTSWGGGPWVSGTGGGQWAASMANGNGVTGFAGAPTWTYGEDEPTETWTLRGANGDARRGSSGQDNVWGRQGESGEAAAEFGAAAANLTAPSASTRTPSAAPVRGRRRGSSGRRAERSAGDTSRELPAGAPPAWERSTGERAAGRPSRRRLHTGRARILIATAFAVLAVAGLAVAAAFALTKHGHAPAAGSTPAGAGPTLASTPSPSVALGRWKHIDSRLDDPVPLSLAELFPAHVTAGARNYTRTAQRESANCTKAVFGSQLKAAVRKGCSQALRASYLSANGKRMGTIGVLNLATSAAAAKLGKIVSAPRQFIEALPAAHGATRNLGKDNGVVWAVAKGHYLILMWVQYANLHNPDTPAARKNLMQFVNDIYQKTANQSLTGRMVTGRPLTP
ncbi:MAG: hypothetical protein ACM3ML_14585 [Micromonosporaceae bacterium]